jgi:hypothetical protein
LRDFCAGGLKSGPFRTDTLTPTKGDRLSVRLGVDHALTFFELLDWSVIHHEKVFAFID